MPGPTTAEELAYFLLERHLDPMTRIVAELPAEHLNATPPGLPGANSPYALLFHTAGMLEWWVGHVILGRDVPRDRKAEFAASGALAELLARVAAVRAGIVDDLPAVELEAPLRGRPSVDYVGTPIAGSARGALLHVFEELAQHHGHLEITRDVLAAGYAR